VGARQVLFDGQGLPRILARVAIGVASPLTRFRLELGGGVFPHYCPAPQPKTLKEGTKVKKFLATTGAAIGVTALVALGAVSPATADVSVVAPIGAPYGDYG